MKNFDFFTREKLQKYIAAHMPEGRVWDAKHSIGSNIYKLTNVVAFVFMDLVQGIKHLSLIKILKNSDYLEQLEADQGIGGVIFRQSDEYARLLAVQKVTAVQPIVNYQDMIDYIQALTGYLVKIETARGSLTKNRFPVEFPGNFLYPDNTGDFYLIVTIPLSGKKARNKFPLLFPPTFFDEPAGNELVFRMETVLNQIIPAYMGWEILLG